MTQVVLFLKRKAPSWVWITGLFLLAGGLYGPFLKAPFSLDDYNLLLGDIHLKDPTRWVDYFYPTNTTAAAWDESPQHSTYYRPLAHTLPFFIYRWAGPRPWVFRLVSLLVFTTGCVGFVFLLQRLGLSEWAAFLAGAVMILHPHNTIAVNYIPAAFAWQWLFSIGMLMGLLRPSCTIKQSVLILLSGLAALFCHESALALLPVGVILLLWRGRSRRRLMGFVLITIIVLLIYKIIKPYRDNFLALWLQWLWDRPWDYIKGFVSVWLLHAKWLVLGQDVVIMGLVPFEESVSDLTAVFGFMVMLFGLIISVWAIRLKKDWGWFVLWYAAGFSIVGLGMLSYPDKGWVVESHWLFPAAAAYAALCGWAVDTIKRKRFTIGYALSILCLLFYGVQAQQINRLWSQEVLYLVHWHRLQPSHALVMFFLGDYYMSRNDFDQAMVWYEKGLAAKPHDWAALNNLALCAIQLKDYDRAKGLLEEIARRFPTTSALNNLAVFYFKELGQIDKALSLWEKAAENPYALSVRYNLARTYLDQGKPEEAMKWLRQNLSVAPEDVTTRILLLEAQLKARHKEAAETAAWLVSRIRSAEELVRLGVLLDEAGYGNWARRFFEQALKRDPSSWRAYEALGVWLANRGFYEAAEKIWLMGQRRTTNVSHFETLLRRLDSLRSLRSKEKIPVRP